LGKGGKTGFDVFLDERMKSKMFFVAVTFLFWVALYLYVPTLPTYIKTKTVLLSKVGLVLSMYGLWMACSRLPMGIAVDCTGRGKPFIMAGLFIAAVGAVMMGAGNSLWMLTAGRAFTGIAAATWVPLLVVFSTFFKPDQAILASSLLTVSSSVGRMVATSLNGFLNGIGGYALAYYCAGVTGVVAIILMSFVSEKNQPRTGISIRSIAGLFLRKDVILPSLLSFVVHYGDWSITFGFLPILAHELGASDVVKSMLISLNIAAITSGNLLNTFLLKRARPLSFLFSGVLIFFFGTLCISRASSIPFVFTGTMCMGFAFGIMYPILLGMSIQKVDRRLRTTAMGIHQSVYAVGMFTGPWVSGIIADAIGLRRTFSVTGFFFLIASFVLIVALRKQWEGNERNL
jgi:DHA1 family multidrug resistance protein-like MFS transporter